MEGFDFSNIELEVVKTNVRPSADDKPYIRLSETPGRFVINGLATQAMGLAAGDNVTFFENKKAKGIDGWFFICKGVGDNVSKAYSPTKKEGIGYNLSISHATIYSRIVQLDLDAREISAEVLEEKGIFVSRQSEKYPERKNYSSLRTVQFELVEAGVQNVNGEDVTFYALVNHKVFETTADEVVIADTEE